MAENFQPYFSILKYILYWPMDTSNSPLLQRIHKVFSAVKITVTVGLYVFLECITLCNSSSWQQMIENSFMIFTNLSYIGKVFFFIFNNEKILFIFNEISLEVFRPKEGHRKEIVSKIMILWKRIFAFYMITCIATLASWGLLPEFQDTDATLPFNYWYPFDVTTSPTYEIAYVYEIGMLYVVAISHVSLDALMAGIMAFISAQIDILNYDLRNLNQIEHFQGHLEEMIPITKQIRCVSFHRKLKLLVRKINEILAFPMIMQALFGAMILCLALYKLSKVAPLSGQGLSFLNYYIAMLVQLSVYFWYGNEIMVKSDELSKSAYQCEWINMNRTFRKHLLFFMLATREPLKIYGGYFVVLSLEPLIGIIKFSYSCYTLLKNF